MKEIVRKLRRNGDRRFAPLENARPECSAPYSEDASGDLLPYHTADTSSPAYRDGVQTTVGEFDSAARIAVEPFNQSITQFHDISF